MVGPCRTEKKNLFSQRPDHKVFDGRLEMLHEIFWDLLLKSIFLQRSGPVLTIMNRPCCFKLDWLMFYFTVLQQSFVEHFQNT